MYTREHRQKKPLHICGTCLWYDPLGHLCRNGKSVRDWDDVESRDGYKKWELDAEGTL